MAPADTESQSVRQDSPRKKLLGNFALAAASYAAAVLACASLCAVLSYQALATPLSPKLLKAALAAVLCGYYLPLAMLFACLFTLLEAAQRLLVRLGEAFRFLLERIGAALRTLSPSKAAEEELRKASGSAFAGEARKALGSRSGTAAALLIFFFAALGFIAPRILRRTPAAAAALAALQLRILLLKASLYALALLSFLLPPVLFTL